MPESMLPKRVEQLGYLPRQLVAFRLRFPRASDREVLESFIIASRLRLDPSLGEIAIIDGKPFLTQAGLQRVARQQIEELRVATEWSADGENWRPVPVEGAEYARCTVTGRYRIDGTSVYSQSVVAIREFVPDWAAKRPSSPWAKMPGHMLGKVARSHALREVLTIGQTYTTEEASTYASEEVEAWELEASPELEEPAEEPETVEE